MRLKIYIFLFLNPPYPLAQFKGVTTFPIPYCLGGGYKGYVL